MNDQSAPNPPPAYLQIQAGTIALGFSMPSNAQTGALLRTLAASKPGGRLLELGTGTGLATTWICAGMDAASTLISVDDDCAVQAVARAVLGHDPRLAFVTQDGGAFIEEAARQGQQFDFIFADTWPGKYTHLPQTLKLVAPGGLYVVDDMLPQANWPADHPPTVTDFLVYMEALPDFAIVKLNWAGGHLIATRLGV